MAKIELWIISKGYDQNKHRYCYSAKKKQSIDQIPEWI